VAQADSEDSGCEAHETPRRRPGLCLFGPSGCGKTAAVYACAEALQLTVIEINPGVARSGALILRMLGEATQSRRVNWSRAAPPAAPPATASAVLDLCSPCKSGEAEGTARAGRARGIGGSAAAPRAPLTAHKLGRTADCAPGGVPPAELKRSHAPTGDDDSAAAAPDPHRPALQKAAASISAFFAAAPRTQAAKAQPAPAKPSRKAAQKAPKAAARESAAEVAAAVAAARPDRRTLILFDDFDQLLDEDAGFVATVAALLQTSKVRFFTPLSAAVRPPSRPDPRRVS